MLATGDWLWRAEAEGTGEPRVAFLPRTLPIERVADDSLPLSESAERVLNLLTERGASFTVDLVRGSALEPSRARAALDELLRRGLVTNDRFDPLRAGSKAMAEALASSGALARRATLGRSRPATRRTASTRPEGRWSRIASEPADDACVAWCAALLDRYGILTRETAALDVWAPPWRELAPCLARAELRGEVRRGYFVEGLSGVQYATAEAAQTLAERAGKTPRNCDPLLISTLDPANLYGAGAPLDIDLLEGGTTRHSPANLSATFSSSCGGRPVLIIEAQGKP